MVWEGLGPKDSPPSSQKRLYRCARKVGAWEKELPHQAFSSPAPHHPQNEGVSIRPVSG